MFEGAIRAITEFATAFVYSTTTIIVITAVAAGCIVAYGVNKKLYTRIKDW